MFIKVAIGIVVSAAAFMYLYWKCRQVNRVQYVRNICYDGRNITTCQICLMGLYSIESGNKPVVALPCKHKFHRECIKLAFNHVEMNSRTCPLCRRPVTEDFICRNIAVGS